jgi:hypothetical protein
MRKNFFSHRLEENSTWKTARSEESQKWQRGTQSETGGKHVIWTVLGIWIRRILMFLASRIRIHYSAELLNPDPDPDPSLFS